MKIIGHRGARGLAPENTLASFQKALDYEVDAIECDIRITKDGVPVVHHDAYAVTNQDNRQAITDYSYEQLQQHYPDLPTLEAAIKFVDQKVPLYLEIKPGTRLEPIVKVIRQCLDGKWRPPDFQFVSFDYGILKALHSEFPDVGIIVNDKWSGIRASWRARRLGSKQIDLFTKVVWIGYVKAVSRRGWQLYVFPHNNVKLARRWEKAGLAGVITDYPDRFAKVK